MCIVHTEPKLHLSVQQWLSEELCLEDAPTLAAVFGIGTSVQQLVRALDIKNDAPVSTIAEELADVLLKHRAHQEKRGSASPIQLPAPFVLRKVAAELREIVSQANLSKLVTPSHGSGAPEMMVRCCTLIFHVKCSHANNTCHATLTGCGPSCIVRQAIGRILLRC